MRIAIKAIINLLENKISMSPGKHIHIQFKSEERFEGWATISRRILEIYLFSVVRLGNFYSYIWRFFFPSRDTKSLRAFLGDFLGGKYKEISKEISITAKILRKWGRSFKQTRHTDPPFNFHVLCISSRRMLRMHARPRMQAKLCARM